jgi:hypothetical protein
MCFLLQLMDSLFSFTLLVWIICAKWFHCDICTQANFCQIHLLYPTTSFSLNNLSRLCCFIFIHVYQVCCLYSPCLYSLFTLPHLAGTFPQTQPILHICESLSRTRFCIWERRYGICLSQSGLFHLTLWYLVPSSFLKII